MGDAAEEKKTVIVTGMTTSNEWFEDTKDFIIVYICSYPLILGELQLCVKHIFEKFLRSQSLSVNVV